MGSLDRICDEGVAGIDVWNENLLGCMASCVELLAGQDASAIYEGVVEGDAHEGSAIDFSR
jgi:hypothetical protein